MGLYDEIKLHDLRELLRSRGVALDRESKTAATWRNERTPSIHVYADHWYDYGAKQGGDLQDWLEVAEGLNDEQAREEAARVIGYDLQASASIRFEPQTNTRNDSKPSSDRATTQNEPRKRAAPPSWIDDLVTQAHAALMRGESEAARTGLTYFKERGLGPLVRVLRLGVVDESVKVPQAGRALDRYRGRAVIPTLEGDRAVWFKARDLSGRTADELKAVGVHKYDGPSGGVPAPFNPAGLGRAREAGFLVICEGEIDGASLLAAYGLEYPVMGLPGGNLPQGWGEKIAEAAVSVYIAMDPDTAGVGHAERLQAALSGLGSRCYRVNLTADLNDLLLEHGEKLPEHFNAALENAALESISDLLYIRETWLAELDARADRPHTFYTTGLAALDTLLEGGYSEGLHLLGGITGGGKTSLALQIAVHNAKAGRSVIYASYEQSRLELWARIAAGLTGVPYRTIKRGVYDDHGQTVRTSGVLKANEAWPQLETVSKQLKIVEGGDALSRQASAYTTEVLAQTAQSVAAENGAPPLIIIDYLQRAPVPAELKLRDPRERVGYVAGLLQVHLAREIGCPVLALSSIGRAFYNLQKMPSLEERIAAFKEAGEIEYTAYTSLLLYGLAEDLQDRFNLRPGMIDTYKPMALDLVKNREGEIGQLGVQWYPARGSWAGAVAVGNRR